MRRFPVIAGAVLGICLFRSPAGLAQTSAPPGGLARGFVNDTGRSVVDQLDVLWVENGHIIFSYGNGKLFGIDVRAAMGNPAALRSTTDVKWQNFLAEFNSRIVLLASRYPALLYPEGVTVNEKDVFNGLSQTYGTLALEEQIDLAAYLMQTSALRGASEETTLNTFSWLGYIGGAAAGAYLLGTNNVTLPVTFPIDKGSWHGLPYDMRVRVRIDEVGFSSTRHPDLRTKFLIRTINYSEASLEFGWKDVLVGSHFKQLDERAAYDLRRYGLYFAGASQTWNPVRQKYDQGYVIGAQADIITPGKFLDTRFRTGAEVGLKNGSKIPDKYSLDVFRRQTLFRGTRDFTIQARGNVLVDGLHAFHGLGGELRASYLLGTNVPKYSSAYSRADWDRFSRVYAIASADQLDRKRNDWSMRMVYAAPFEFDRAIESIWERRDAVPDPADALDPRGRERAER